MGFVSFHFPWHALLGLSTRALHVCSSHVYDVQAVMCLKAVCCVDGEHKHHVLRMCTHVYSVCVCTQCVFLQVGCRSQVTLLVWLHSALTIVKCWGGKWSRTSPSLEIEMLEPRAIT